MRQMLRAALAFIVMALAARTAMAANDLTIEITKGNDQAIPIAVVPFKGEGTSPGTDVAQVVADDLEHSGRFDPIDRKDLISLPGAGDTLNYSDWKMINANYVVVGKMTPEGNGYKISFELHDVLGQKRVLGQYVSASRDQLRAGAHFIADQIYKKITDVRGAFSTQIAYVSATGTDQNMQFTLNVSDYDGYNARQVLSSNEPILSPAWSPDGKKLAYVSFEGGRPAIYVQQLTSGKRIKLTSFKGINGAPAWSPDGRRLAMSLSKSGHPEIYVMNLADRSLTRLTNSSAINTEPSWSPDGQHILFTSDRSGGPQLYEYTLGSGQVSRKTFTGPYNAGGHYSPDGKNIFMVTRDDSGYHVAKQSLENGRVTVLTKTRWDEAPTIAPNGTMVEYATQRGTQGVLGLVSDDGKAEFVIPSTKGNVREPAWSPFTD
ncbi:Tol-Pal system beta propeller repeat protein TolB [Larsenimonas suaedae]|uniref:Tol-Pal system protein TolB n=2 Tax=Larsenimonas suaedae TaxID=1851019 RepID=A0ABU1GVN1_9GAMM|nr:Tol-Pal system beta propeller repeat protein TolB [Larsenimonas suaedae]MCM2971362.1 Tol-Pal system beta propeller repeat protein TolB [Larsenimonas suaedae]MDR5896073.1 Tol-Pal system beta propeller repeat protein TolB [Larsenimonas suaedae]